MVSIAERITLALTASIPGRPWFVTLPVPMPVQVVIGGQALHLTVGVDRAVQRQAAVGEDGLPCHPVIRASRRCLGHVVRLAETPEAVRSLRPSTQPGNARPGEHRRRVTPGPQRSHGCRTRPHSAAATRPACPHRPSTRSRRPCRGRRASTDARHRDDRPTAPASTMRLRRRAHRQPVPSGWCR